MTQPQLLKYDQINLPQEENNVPYIGLQQAGQNGDFFHVRKFGQCKGNVAKLCSWNKWKDENPTKKQYGAKLTKTSKNQYVYLCWNRLSLV